MFIINPGTGPVAGATEQHATANMGVLCDDLRAKGVDVETFIRRPRVDNGDGRFTFEVTLGGERPNVEVQMPGLPVERVRWMREPGQDIWDFPRLYVDGNSWVWFFALDVIADADEDDDA